MVMIKLTPDFKEFLQLVNSEKIEYLLLGGYAQSTGNPHAAVWN